jgi:alanine-synthesizing transaminase
MFSKIVSRLRSETNPLYRLREDLEAKGNRIVDFVSGNVNNFGICFPQPLLEEILIEASRRAQIYRPDSFGQEDARKAISSYYKKQGAAILPENIVLTPGTSVSYWYCFKLLADEGEEILCPSPSYPLFNYIAELSDSRMVSYRLRESQGWQIDLEYLEGCISTKSRALILISPHNPTGRVASVEEIDGLVEIALRHELAIISDEVFSELLCRDTRFPRVAGSRAPLIFTLNGFSKMFALPGLKLGWMAISGEKHRVREAMRALELISDTFLSVNEIAQAATPALFERGQTFLQSYVGEIRKRWSVAQQVLSRASRLSFTEPDGGLYVTLRLHELSEESAAEVVLRRNHILVHPGYLYDIRPDHLILSFAREPEALQDGLSQIVTTLEELE